jgi:alkylation response protein AidB-like acyl-CoA dehydrogenase
LDLEQFRQDTKSWIQKEVPDSLRGTRKGRFDGCWGGRNPAENDPDVLRWLHVMSERGWTAPTWPQEFGGGGLSAGEARVLEDILAELKLPPPLVGFGLAMIGPTLLDFGTEDQKKRHVPPICRGEIRWCQGYSEPGAGSDLAGLQTKAILKDGAFDVTGQKVWTSHADKSDWIFCLARTDPKARKKQEGITFLLVDMADSAVSTKEIQLISGASPFCEVFLDHVQVPLENVIGEVNQGWTVAKALLGYERSMIGEAMGGQLAGAEKKLLDLAENRQLVSGGRLLDFELRSAISQYAMEERAFSYTLQKVHQSMKAGQAPGSESSVLKICGSELKQKNWELTMQIAGPESVGWEGDEFDEADLENTREWLRSRANTIEGGTTEIQLNIIAKRVLKLPSRS